MLNRVINDRSGLTVVPRDTQSLHEMAGCRYAEVHRTDWRSMICSTAANYLWTRSIDELCLCNGGSNGARELCRQGLDLRASDIAAHPKHEARCSRITQARQPDTRTKSGKRSLSPEGGSLISGRYFQYSIIEETRMRAFSNTHISMHAEILELLCGRNSGNIIAAGLFRVETYANQCHIRSVSRCRKNTSLPRHR